MAIGSQSRQKHSAKMDALGSGVATDTLSCSSVTASGVCLASKGVLSLVASSCCPRTCAVDEFDISASQMLQIMPSLRKGECKERAVVQYR